jgi:hypothetical protein
MADVAKFEELNILAQKVFASLCEGDPIVAQAEISTIIDLLLTKPFHKFSFHKILDESSASKLQSHFEKIAQVLSIECERNSSDGKEQVMVNTSLGKTMLQLLTTDDNSDMGHNVISRCKSWTKPRGNTKEKNECRHDIPLIGTNDHLFRCDFHQHDSIMTHLVLACLINGQYALKFEKDDHFVFLSMFTGLVHDCAKLLTRQLYEFEGKCFTGFPAHVQYREFIQEIEDTQSEKQTSGKSPLMVMSGKTADVKAKILVNNNVVNFGNRVVPHLRAQFPEISGIKDCELSPMIKKIVMDLQPWIPDVSSRIDKIDWSMPKTKSETKSKTEPTRNVTVYNRLIIFCLS